MFKKKLEIVFRNTGETKNNYTFEQVKEPGGETVMFPNKIYLNKKVFSRKPSQLAIMFK